jgi:hypothetical protein
MMRLTKEQKTELLPLLQKAVQAQIDLWEASGAIEGVLDKTYDNMGEALAPMAVTYDSGSQVTAEDLQVYVDGIEFERESEEEG